ncbi:prenyltransferase beta subunit [Paenibacillus phyllosphaerae]|uniref:Prenyltransferase beta subunit n=1 Tax=Paenibacillus phyllosphaerae TaxID=274593 RepID=A0A7W5FPV1_9BACL|nr:DUF4430 domain-containing protein [Paenibacillus phyllosphaerae]MBB3112765.1 prenyltransferase beta subunit [Paenibacillus phyllosphaerae]
MKQQSGLRRSSVRYLLTLILTFAVFMSNFGQAYSVYADEPVEQAETIASNEDESSAAVESAEQTGADQADSQQADDNEAAAESEETSTEANMDNEAVVEEESDILAAANADITADPLLAEVQAAIEGAAQNILGLAKIGDWQAVGLSGADKQIPSNYVAGLYKTLVKNKGTFSLVTDYERTVIGLTAAHQDATKFAGYNLVEQIYNNTKMENQGLNGSLYALIALDSGRYTVPEDALWTRDKLVAAVIAKQKADGGFALFGTTSDPDITGMTLTALAPYTSQADVQAAVDKAVNWLSVNQKANGGYLSWGTDASESVAQAIIALASQGIDPTESRFTKNGVNLVQKLLSFRQANGTFSHTPTGTSNSIATEQALQALVAYESYKTGGNRLYDFGTPQNFGWPSHWILESGWSDTEWQAVAIARAGLEVPESYLTTLPSLDFVKEYPEYAYVTDYERIVIALSALRQDASDYDDFNIVENIYNSDKMEAQGLNGLVFGLIALDSGEYTTPNDAKWNRDKLLAAILDKQNDDGGFTLSTGASDPDMTAMTLTALAPYMTRAEVKTAGELAVQWLSANQQANGGYLSWGTDASESVAQVIIALASNGIDPTSAAFTKNGITLLDKLFAFFQPDGGFSHVVDPQAATDNMATEQAQQALTAYEMYVNGDGRLYQMGKPIHLVSLQVEGPEGLIAEGSVESTNVLDALEQLLGENQIPLTVTDSDYGKYVSAINNIAAGKYGGYDGWMFDVYRDGKWSFPAVGMDAFELQSSDRVVVYYTGDDTQLIESVQVTPASPEENEAFTVSVQKTASIWNGTSSEIVTSAAAGVVVKIDGVTVETNAEGVAAFANGVAEAGTYTIEVTGYETGKAPQVVRSTKSLTIAPSVPVQVSLQVEGPEGPIAEGNANGVNALDALEQLLAENEIPITVTDSSFGKYVSAINNIAAGKYGGYDGWMFNVYRDGQWSFPAVGMDAFKLKETDKIVVYYTGSDTQLIESIQVAPTTPKEDEAFTVSVQKIASVWNGTSSEIVTSPAAGVEVKIDGVTVETNAEGVATFANGVTEAGTYSIEVTDYETGKAPHVVRTTKSLAIAEKPATNPGNGGGGTTTETITLSVTGDSQKGTILASKQVVLQAGDTAYTVLARELPGKVRSEGSGSTLYVEAIDDLAEFDRGEKSGWMYSVNGKFPNYSAGAYTLKANDIVAWRYTLDLGLDLGVDPSDWDTSGGSSSGVGQSVTSVVNVPQDLKQDYVQKLNAQQKDTEFTLNIPNVSHKIILNVEETKDGLPKLTASKGNLIFAIDKGTKITSGGNSIELFTSLDRGDEKLLSLVNGSLAAGANVETIGQAFIMGAADQSFLFDKTLTLTIKGGKGQVAGFIEGGVFTPIQLYASDEAGKQATQGSEKITYAYVDGDNLIMKTNHFTSFVTYTTTNQQETEDSFDLSKLYTDADQVSAWAKDAIAEASQQGFVQGSGGKLSPKAAITRAEFTKLMVSVLGLPTASSTSRFKDVPASSWFAPYVEAAYKAGFITGYDGQFQPNATITREQMAVMIVRALGLDKVSATGATVAISDLKAVSPWAQAAVQTSVSLKLMLGQGDRFNPAGEVTREMAAVVAMRSYAYDEQQEASNPSAPTDQTDVTKQQTVQKQIAATAAYLQKTVTAPTVSTLGGEWTVLGLARSGLQIPDAYYAAYYANLEKTLKESDGVLHSVKYTEYDRAILALTAIGKSVTNAAGYNLLEPLADFETVTKQGINGPIFALIALDSKQYAIPTALGVKTQTTRELLIDFVLKRKIEAGGWALGTNPAAADPDVTAMAVQALAPYYGTNPSVKAAVDEALIWLSANQQADGGFVSNKANNAESVAQVVVALTSLGINPHTDARFVKNGHSAIDALLGFAATEGGFYHIQAGGTDNGGAEPGTVDLMATDQAMYAMVAYDRLLNKQTRLYDMTDV